MSDYTIRVNEDGQPFIAHAFGNRENHKYLMKIGEGAKARYFYTQEEVRAYMQGGRQKAENTLGVAAKKELNSAKGKLSSAIKTADKAQLRSEKLNSKGERDSNGQNWFKSKGLAEAAGRAELNAVRKTNDIKNKQNDVKGAQSRYDNTPLGKAEKFGSDLKSTKDRMKEDFQRRREERAPKFTMTVRDKNGNETVYTGQDAKEKRKEYSTLIKEQAKQQLGVVGDEAKRAAKDAASNVKDKARDVADAARASEASRAIGIYQRKQAEDAAKEVEALKENEEYYKERKGSDYSDEDRDRYEKNLKSAEQTAQWLKEDYDKSLLGKAEKFGSDLKSTKDRMKDQIKSAIPGAKINGNNLTLPSGNVVKIPEEFIKEGVIPEQFIEEQIIKEKRIKEKKS